MKRPGVIIFAALLLGIALILLLPSTPDKLEIPKSPPSPPTVRTVEQDGLTILRDTPFDLEFTKAGGSPERDLQLLHETLASARLLVKDHFRLPIADNRDFTRFLTGQNSHRVAWIAPDHPRINANDELTDRWGTPLFFHQESSSETSLRSAGPDRKMWTEDDLTYADAAPESS
jgi:hypothetical protein